jgi:hypothetical protein
MPVIVIAFHLRILDAITGMICGYAGPKGEVIFDHRHNPESGLSEPDSGGIPTPSSTGTFQVV